MKTMRKLWKEAVYRGPLTCFLNRKNNPSWSVPKKYEQMCKVKRLDVTTLQRLLFYDYDIFKISIVVDLSFVSLYCVFVIAFCSVD